MERLEEVVRRVRAGDREAYSEIVRAYQDMLLAYAAFRVPDPALVDEVVQQTFIRAYEQLDEYRPGKDFGVWLRAICRFMILAELKRACRERENRREYRERLKLRLLEEALGRAEGGAEGDLRERLERCLDRLQETSRALLRYRYEQLLKIEEIARRLDQSAAWVATTLFRIREALRECLEQGTA
ncbi:MAG TPA: sigma-70 family RNA polymerase sigma factor [Planctomycetota bacterium]|nr:sigma-70 family RNA polymerase sigma factor [Planctomycetota bacterium]